MTNNDDRIVIDTRPENINTTTETHNGQSAQYKIIDAYPIIGRVLDKLAFFRTHASAVWYNKLAGKTIRDKFDELDNMTQGLFERRILTFTPSPGVTGLNVMSLDNFVMVANGLKITNFQELPIVEINGTSYRIVGKATNNNSFRRSGPEVNHMYNCIISNGDGYSAVDTKQLTLGYDGTNSYILIGTTGSPTYLYLSAPYRILNMQQK